MRSLSAAGRPARLRLRSLRSPGFQSRFLVPSRFPRGKVWAGDLKIGALEALRQAGLSHVTGDDRESQVTQLELIRGRQRTHLRLPPGRVICRPTLDAALMDAAKSAGAQVLTGAQATVGRTAQKTARSVTVVRNGREEMLSARVVICADGLSRTSVRHLPECVASVAPNSRVGIGAFLTGDFYVCANGQLTMVLSRHGYVGIS